MPKENEILGLGNHQKVRRILLGMLGSKALKRYDGAIRIAVRRWYRLGMSHLGVARKLSGSGRQWRSQVSRCYYAAYNASRSVRWLVHGSVSLEPDDHKRVGDLPSDFPDREIWNSFFTQLRMDRNRADYEPWSNSIRDLEISPSQSLQQTVSFIKSVRRYLISKGITV
ncbi:MAG: hypothetical protein ACREBU_10930 [Nitrososphaera sp.]